MTREELDELERDVRDDLARGRVATCITTSKAEWLIWKARRAIELETCQCGRELSRVCMICDNDD